jgi:hypothetical protein
LPLCRTLPAIDATLDDVFSLRAMPTLSFPRQDQAFPRAALARGGRAPLLTPAKRLAHIPGVAG